MCEFNNEMQDTFSNMYINFVYAFTCHLSSQTVQERGLFLL